MYITFEKVRYKNFLSTGNQFTEIDMTASPKTLIHGTNGSGKTTFVDAVFFALYGKSFRKVKKDSVVNYITKKHAMVELEFSIRHNKYKIERGIKPNVFNIYCNDVKVDQESTAHEYQKYLETFILHMNEKLFTQTVLLGSTNYTPFMLLPALDRRNVVESLLDIQIFSVMNELAKDKNKTLLKRYTNTEYEIEKSEISIGHLQNHIDSVHGNRDDLINSIKSKIKMNQQNIDKLEGLRSSYESDMSTYKEKRDAVGKKESLESMISNISNYKSQFVSLINTNNKKIKFYETNDSCPTCSQQIDESLKRSKVEEYETATDKFTNGVIQADKTIDEQKDLLEKYTYWQDQIDTEVDNITTCNQKIDSLEKSIVGFREDIEEIKSKSDVNNQMKSIQEEKKKKKNSKKVLSETQETLIHYKTVLDLLKDDGIKSKIVKTYIPVINKLIKKYLDILDFPILFKFDEGFNEFIKVRGRDEVTFPNLSEGERMRVNLSLIFAFRELAKLRNATHCNLIIFDEVADSSLDITGWDSFLKILKDVCGDGKQNTFIISHKGDEIINKFDRDIKFDKKGGRFSEIVE